MSYDWSRKDYADYLDDGFNLLERIGGCVLLFVAAVVTLGWLT